MNNKDLCFLSLIALACLYLDVRVEGRTRASVAEPARPRSVLPLPRPSSGCPRNGAHLARRRADGAVWCLHCDEAFYPRAAEWEGALLAATA